MTHAMLTTMIKRYWKILIGMILICSLGGAVLTGLTGSYLSLERSLDRYMEDYGLADAEITIDATDNEDLAETVRQLPGVEGVDTRFTGNTVMKEEAGKYAWVRILFYEEEDRQAFYYWEKADAGGAVTGTQDVLLEYKFASDRGIRAGDTISFRVDDEYRDYVVGGIVSTPETLGMSAEDGVAAIPSEFGYIYAPRSLLKEEKDPEHERALKKWEKKRQELDETKEEAQDEHDSALTKIRQAEDKLKKGEEEYQQALPGLRSKQSDLEHNLKQQNDAIDNIKTAQKSLKEQEQSLTGTRDLLQETEDTLQQAADAVETIQDHPDDTEAAAQALDELNAAMQRLDEQLTALRDSAPADMQEELLRVHERIVYLEMETEMADPADPVKLRQIISGVGIVLEESEQDLTAIMDGNEKGIRKIRTEQEKLAERRGLLEKSCAETEKGIALIKKKINDGKQRIADGHRTVSTMRAEADAAWRSAKESVDKAEKKLADTKKELDDWEGYETWYNQMLLYFEPGVSHEQVLVEAERVIEETSADAPAKTEPVSILSSVLYRDSQVKANIDENLIPLQKMIRFVPALLFGVALLTVFLFFSIIVLRTRREIGILRALGYSTGRIRALFSMVGISVALLASLLSIPESMIIQRIMSSFFRDHFALPDYVIRFSVPQYLLACALTVAVCLAAVLAGTWILGRIQPSEAMSAGAPAPPPPGRVLSARLHKLKPVTRFTILSMLRNKGRFLFSAFCLASTLVLIFTSLSIIASMNKIMEETFEERIHYDYEIFYPEKPDAKTVEEIASVRGVQQVQPVEYYSAELINGDKRETISLYAMDTDSDMIGIYDEDHRSMQIPANGVLLEHHAAKAVGARDGDLVQINGNSVQINGLSRQSIERQDYISPARAKSLGKPTAGILLCRVDEEGQARLSEYLTEDESCLFAVSTDAVREKIDDIYRGLKMYAWIIVAFAALMGILIVITSYQHNILEVKSELCTLRTLGFGQQEIAIRWLAQSTLHYVVSCLIGLPAGFWIAAKALHYMQDPTKEYPMSDALWPYLLTLGIVAVYVLFSHFYSMSEMKRWDITREVNRRE